VNGYPVDCRALEQGNIDMVQWRNLNYDPLYYFRDLKIRPEGLRLLGMRQAMEKIQKKFPHLLTGYFNPLPPKVKKALCS